MWILFIIYFIYLLLYGLISYAILFHLVKYQIEGDKSKMVLMLYLVLSAIIIIGSIVFLRPF
ncbi:MAG TPA: hypothetical protein VGE59_01925 [Patescibacteria group bacterium]